MKYIVEVAGQRIDVEVDGDRILVNGRVADARLAGAPGSAIRRLHRGRSVSTVLAAPGDGRGAWSLALGGCRIGVLVLDPRDAAIRAAGARTSGGAASRTLKAPMPGMVLRVLVEEGADVEAGQGLVVLEAMKMENQLKAASSGKVGKVHVAPGARVEKGAVLIELV